MTAKIKYAVCLLLMLLVSACGQKPLTAKQILDQAYPNYNQKHACWIVDVPDGGSYCMTLDSEQKVALKDGERLYVLAVGQSVDENGESAGAHATPGLVGTFVSETMNGKTQLVASNPMITVGSGFATPVKWKLVKLGPADYWGWQNTWGDCHQGYCGNRKSILAPYGKSVKEIGDIISQYDDVGACSGMSEKLDEDGNPVLDENGDTVQVEMDCDKTTSDMQSTLKIDTQNSKVKVYPLLITVTGQDNGTLLKSKTWVFNFDSKSWQYKEPENYPLADKDF